MATGFMPYEVVGTQQGLLESRYGAEQAQKQSQFDIGQQKGEMTEEFQKESIASQKKQEELLEKQRKGKWWEKLLPVASMFLGPVGSSILGGLQGMYSMGKQSKFAKQQIEKARGAGLGSQWGGTFLGGQARDITGKTETMLDRMQRETDVSGMDLLTKGLTSGISSYAMGKIGEGVKDTFAGLKSGDVVIGEKAKALKAVKKSGLDKMSFEDAEGLGIDPKWGDISKTDMSKLEFKDMNKLRDLGEKLGTNISSDPTVNLQSTLNKALGFEDKQTFLSSLFGAGGFGQDMSTLLEEDGIGQDSLKSLLMLITQMQQGE